MTIDTDQLPLTVLVPETIETPVEVFDRHAALRIAVVENGGEKHIAPEWDQPGVYLLIGRLGEQHAWSAYVGKATELKSRICGHDKPWYRAILVRRDTTYGFTSADIGWLEGRLHEMLETAENANLLNRQRPGDETLPPYDKQMLEQVVLPVQRLLRLLGHDPSPPGDTDDLPGKAQSKSNRHYGIKLRQIIEAGLLEPGTPLTSTNGAWPANARVTQDGNVEVNGEEYSTPSAAAQAVKGGGTANGWDFWAVTNKEGRRSTLALLRKKYGQKKEPQSSKPPRGSEAQAAASPAS